VPRNGVQELTRAGNFDLAADQRSGWRGQARLAGRHLRFSSRSQRTRRVAVGGRRGAGQLHESHPVDRAQLEGIRECRHGTRMRTTLLPLLE